QVLAAEADAPGHHGLRRQQPQQAHGDRGLPGSRLAGHAEGLTGGQGQVDPSHGVHALFAGAVGDRQVTHLQQGYVVQWGERAVVHRGCTLALRTCSTARPTRVNPSTMNRMATPGGIRYHQAPAVTAPCMNAVFSIDPHDTDVGSPRPKKVNVASARMALATVRVLVTRIKGMTLGSTCRVMIWVSVAPSAR